MLLALAWSLQVHALAAYESLQVGTIFNFYLKMVPFKSHFLCCSNLHQIRFNCHFFDDLCHRDQDHDRRGPDRSGRCHDRGPRARDRGAGRYHGHHGLHAGRGPSAGRPAAEPTSGYAH